MYTKPKKRDRFAQAGSIGGKHVRCSTRFYDDYLNWTKRFWLERKRVSLLLLLLLLIANAQRTVVCKAVCGRFATVALFHSVMTLLHILPIMGQEEGRERMFASLWHMHSHFMPRFSFQNMLTTLVNLMFAVFETVKSLALSTANINNSRNELSALKHLCLSDEN